MNAVWTRTRAELRRRIGETILLIVFLGVAGGAVLGALAGSRRTDTAYTRMRGTTDAGDVLVSVECTGLRGLYGEVAQLPGVAEAGVAAGADLRVSPSSLPAGAKVGNELLQAFVSVDAAMFNEVGRPVITAGRLPYPDRLDEGFANRFLAEDGIGVGTTLEVQVVLGESGETVGQPLPLKIVGTGVFTNEVVPISVNDSFPLVALTPAFYKAYLEPSLITGCEDDRDSALAFDGAFVRLDPGADVTAFRKGVDDLIVKHEETTGGFFFLSEEDRTPVIRRAVRPQVVALQLFGFFTAITTLLLVAQAVARHLHGDATEYGTLRALGMNRRQLLTIGVIRTTFIAVGGALIAVGLAIATSPLMPIGPARLAEPAPGVAVDAGMMGLGALCILVALLVAVAVPLVRHARPGSRRPEQAVSGRSSRLSRFLSGTGAPISMTTGVRLAVDPGRGPTSVPVRSATIGTILAVGALAVTVTFGSSLDRLIATPRLYGQNWDLGIDGGFGLIPASPAVQRLNASQDVAAFSVGIHGEVTVEDMVVSAVGIDPFRGSVLPTILEGRAPTEASEIALGTATLRKLGRYVGDGIETTINDETRRMRVVGRAVFPKFGLGSFATTGLGEGALTTVDALVPAGEELPGFSFFLVRFRGDAPPGAMQRVRDAVVKGVPECDAGFCYITPLQQPGDVTNFSRVRATPLVLAGLLALLAIAAVGHALITSVRRHARDLAILKSVGFVRRQVSATVAWQATTMIVISLVVGIPAGIAAGRAIWNGFADRLGVPPEPVVPVTVVLVGVVAALVLANLAAALPGARAARLSPAVVLRDE